MSFLGHHFITGPFEKATLELYEVPLRCLTPAPVLQVGQVARCRAFGRRVDTQHAGSLADKRFERVV